MTNLLFESPFGGVTYGLHL